MRLRTRAELDFKKGYINHWRNDDQLKKVLDEKYHSLLDTEENFQNVNTPVQLVKNAIEDEMVEKINERFKEFNTEKHFTYSDFIIGSENVKGDYNKINRKNKIITSINLKSISKEHPFLFWLQIIIDVVALILGLVQIGWIKL